MQTAEDLKKKQALLERAKNLMLREEYQAALDCGKELSLLDNKDCEAFYVSAMAYMHLGDYEASLRLVEKIKKIDASHIGAFMAEAYVYKKQGRILSEKKLLQQIIAKIEKLQADEGKECYGKSLSEAWSLLGSAYTRLGCPTDALDAFLTSSRLEQDENQRIKEYSNALFVSNYIEDMPLPRMRQLHQDYQKFFQNVKQYHHFIEKKEKIRIGYISPDLRRHPVAFFLYPLLANFSSDRFEVYCYANNAMDSISMQLQKFVTEWRDVSTLDADTIARQIYADSINILVDLSGHTKNNCLPVLARKPAPIQVSGIGYFNTTGLSTVDYFLSDVYCDPPGGEEDFTEKLLRLPHSHFCYVPSSAMPEAGAAPVCANGYITFGSFNNFNKMTDGMLLLWLQILKGVAGSKLVLKSEVFNNAEGKKAAEERLISLGFDLSRIDFREFTADYLLQYQDLDIALDTHPYTGGMTTCEALYMGVPVITLGGNRHGARFGASLLNNAGFSEFIAADGIDYVEKAIAIAFDHELIDGLHKSLRTVMRQSALMDVKQYVGDVEKAYSDIWQELAESQKNEKLSPGKCQYLRDALEECICCRDFQQAEGIAKRVLRTVPKDHEVLEKLTCIYIETENKEAARHIVNRLIQAYPQDGYGLFLAARVDYLEEAWDAAVKKSHKALHSCRDITQGVRSMLHNLLGNCYKNLGESAQSVAEYLKASQHSVDDKSKAVEYSNYLFNLHYLPNLTQEEMYKAHLAYNTFFSNIKTYQHEKKERSQKLRIGYISPDMRYHVVTFFSYTLFKNYDKTLFEVTCYAKCAEDSISRNIAGFVDHWRNISGMDDAAAAKCIYEDGIDILVDLSGHTRNNCLPILAYKPAPIQISGIGYFDTTGLLTVDYFLADQYTDPVGENDEYFSEKILRLKHSHFCYVPSDMMPSCSTAAYKKNGYITFGSFNNFTKTTDEMLLLWKRIMEKVPEARLVLKSKIFGTSEGIRKVKERLEKIGLPIGRIDLRPETVNYLEEYADIDIALDTFPYPGGGTTCDALYMGIPVVTMVGRRHGSRFGYSLMENVGLGCCCAFSAEDYVNIAVRLAHEEAWLDKVHMDLRQQMKDSPLMDAALYMSQLEDKYLQIWESFLQPEATVSARDLQIKLLEKATQGLKKRDWEMVIRCTKRALVYGEIPMAALLAMASAYFKLGDYERTIFQAKGILAAAIDTRDMAEVQLLLGQSYRETLDYVAAQQAFSQAEKFLPQSRFAGDLRFRAETKKARAFLEITTGNVEAGKETYRQIAELPINQVERCQSYSSYLLSLHYREVDRKVIYREHCKYADLFAGIPSYVHKNKNLNARLRIGYISADFRQQVMFYFYHQLLACYDHQKFEVICYSLGQEDNFTRHLRKLVDKWQDVSQIKDYKEVAALIYEDKVDILVDLGGHAANSGLPVLAYKPAPLQVSGLGYVNTTGLPQVDYFLTDVSVDPVGENDEFFVEKLLRLPHSQFCFTGRSDVPPTQKAPCREKGFVTFASFNQYVKITDEMLKIWLEILQRVENSRLLLKAQVFVSATATIEVKNRLQNMGYDMKRVDFAPTTDPYMQEYLNVDIALDSYPYPGGGTTCDALYMGVPVVSMYGKQHGTRFGYSILKNVGLEELAVQTPVEYITKAVALANDWELLDALHINLRKMMLESPLMDEKIYLRDIENAYQEIWQKYYINSK